MANTGKREGESGYDYEFVEPPPERLLCRICRLPCRNAQSIESDHFYCKRCIAELKIKPSAIVDRDIEVLKIYCPNKSKNECGWIGEISHVEDHLRRCEITCSKCKQIVYFSTMKSHLDTQCPCYCPYCDVTAEREVISREHKEKCHKFALTLCTNSINIGVDNVHQGDLDKPNKAQKEVSFLNEMLNSNTLVELHEAISTMRREVQSAQIAKEGLEKNDKQNDITMLKQLYNIKSYLTVAVLVMAILIAVILLQVNSLQNRLEEDAKMHKQNFIELQQQIALLQEVLNKTVADLQYFQRLSSSVWSTKLWLSSEFSSKMVPVFVKMSYFTKRVMDKVEWYSTPFFAFKEGYQMCLKVYAAGYDDGEG